MAAVVPADVVPTLLAFLLLLVGEGSWMAPAYSSSSSDAMALLSFKAAVKEDPGGLLSLWGRGEYAQYPCYWHGVACSNPNGSVVSLVLPNAGLVAPLRPLLSALSGLQKLLRLDLSGNSLFGNFSDYPPPSLPSLLRSLDLSRNGISGALPLGVFLNLQDLNLSANALSGGIPPQLFPTAAGLNLQVLDLSQNNLTGTIPSTIAACAHLSLLNLASNRLSGILPEDFVGSLVSLEFLYLGNNSFMGSLPGLPGGNSSLGLKILDLSSNRISGTISPQICVSLPLLERLLLQNNELSGGLPAALANCTELRALGLSFNSLTGPLPPEWSELSKLESLSAWNSGLTGEIPPQYGRLGQLRNLILNDNKLSGVIPAELGNCTRMEWLSLSSNQLMGEIPEVGDAVTVLQLGGNLLSGELPPGLGNCTHLLWLDASGNELTGAISPHLFNGSRHALNKTTLGGDTFAFARNMADGVCHGIGSLLDFSGLTTAALWSVPSLRPCAPTARLYLGTTLSSNPDFSSIQYLDLSRNRLHGSIPTELGNAQALQILDLSHNSLYGTIPASFALLWNLGVLDLSNNELEGSIWPLANCTFLVQINLSDNFFSGVIPQTGQLATASASAYANNPALCGEPLLACGAAAATSRSSGNSPSRSRRFGVLSRATIIILLVLVSLALLCLAAIALALLAGARKRRRQKTLLSSIHSSFDGSHSSWNLSAEKEPLSINVATFERPLVRKLTFSHLVEATDGFSRGSLIGRGGFGEVYRARLKDDGTLVAIKKLVQCACQGDREFMAEMETLGKIKHRNLVPLLGYCKVGEERLLVYEFMEGGSLDEVLHTGSREHLTWEQRKRIAKGAARGLAFLHHNCIPHIIHRDMKSSNVLLDKDMEARVSDFGMARLINALDTHLSVSTLAGTPGYVPPEYYQSFRCTAKGDVYSFGVVLLELLTGRRPTDKEGAPEFDDNCNLVGWVKLHVTQKREMDVLDPVLLREKRGDDEGGSSTPAVEQEMLHYLRIACSCLEDLPFKRPSILQVVAMFKDLDNFDMPASQMSCSSSSSSSLSSQPNLAQRVLNHFSFSSSENPKGDIEDLLSNNRGGTT